MQPPIRNARRVSFSASIRPVNATVSPVSRLTTVTVRTGRISGGAVSASRPHAPARPRRGARQAEGTAIRKLDRSFLAFTFPAVTEASVLGPCAEAAFLQSHRLNRHIYPVESVRGPFPHTGQGEAFSW